MVRVIDAPLLKQAAGEPPKTIAEYIGREVSGTIPVSIAMMKSPPGWSEPGQIPEFEEYTLVLSGNLLITTKTEVIHLGSGQTAIAPAGEWVRYSSPQGADYIAICLPAFSSDTVHRDSEAEKNASPIQTHHPGIIFEEHGAEALDRIEDLWNELNEHHACNARYFKEQLQARPFTVRCNDLLATNRNRNLLVHLALNPESEQYVGFCISSSTPGEYGEIESIYVQPVFRCQGIGSTFMNRACTWFAENDVTEYRVRVCEGNEDSFRFYERYGFYLRQHLLIRR
jgi:ribosomal protein S18 acetylase RimI-like enzyme